MLRMLPWRSLLQDGSRITRALSNGFSLYVLDGYPHNEIAEVMQITVGTSKSNLARARGILKNKLIEYWNDQDHKSNLKNMLKR